MSGIFLRQGDELVAMVEAPYEAESVLQELLAKYPALLAGGDLGSGSPWVLVRREAGVGLGDEAVAHGYLDHLFVDASGVPTLVEVKRSTDTRIRREVVGQMLDYAANAAARWGGDALERWFDETCASRGEDPEQVLLDAFPAVENAAAYWEQVRTNVVAERMRLVFVADSVPSELRRIVEFLNGQMMQTEVLAIEVKQYRDVSGQHETLVPRVVGQTEAAKQAKQQATTRRWTREEIVAQVEEHCGADQADVARRIFAWARDRGDLHEWYGSGKKDGSYQAGYQDPADRYIFPFALYGYGRVEIHFQYMLRRPPFDDLGYRRQLRDKLTAIPGVNIGDEMLTKRPSIPLRVLVDERAFQQLIEAIDWALEMRVQASKT